MRKGRKVLACMMAAVTMMSLVGGCSSVPKETSGASGETVAASEAQKEAGFGETVTLRMWGGVPAEAGPQAVCDNFNELYKDKGIQVEYERFVNDDTGNLKLETNLLSGTGVDLYMTYTPDVLTKRAEGNMALDLTELMERDGFKLTDYFGTMSMENHIPFLQSWISMVLLSIKICLTLQESRFLQNGLMMSLGRLPRN